MKKTFLLLSLLLAVVSIANAQEEIRTEVFQRKMDTHSWDKFLFDEVGGRASDMVTIFIDRPGEDQDQVLSTISTVDGWYAGLRGGGVFDAGQGASNGFGAGGSIVLGYSAYRFDWDISAGADLLTDPIKGKTYLGLNCFFEPEWNFAHWGRYDDKKMFIGPKIGLQECKDLDNSYFDNENITIENDGNGRSMGLAYGLTFGFEKRYFFKPVKWGLSLSGHVYDTKYKYKTTVNDVVIQDDARSPMRFCVEATVFVKFGLNHKKVDNFSGKYSVADTYYKRH